MQRPFGSQEHIPRVNSSESWNASDLEVRLGVTGELGAIRENLLICMCNSHVDSCRLLTPHLPTLTTPHQPTSW